MFHDTHVHLEMLLEQLRITYNLDRYEPSPMLEFDKLKLDELLIDHEFVIQSTLNSANFLHTFALFRDNPKVRFLLGFHPEEVTVDSDIEKIMRDQREILTSHKQNIVGIGEIGLDYYVSEDLKVRQKQKELFIAHCELALEFGLSIAVHIRDIRGSENCMDDSLSILASFTTLKNRFVVHCFTGTKNQATRILELGGYLGFGGIVTYNSGKEILEIAKDCPLESLLLETDLPFLAPTPLRGKACLPEYIKYTAETIAQAKQISSTQVWEYAKINSDTLFGHKK